VLVATDRPEDADVLSSALSRESVATTVVSDGISVLNRLMDVEDHGEQAVDLLVLDLSLSDVDGRTVLDAIRSGPRLQSLPVVAIVGDDDESPTSLDPNGTLRRSDDRSEFERAAESMARFWVECVVFPPGETKPNGPHQQP
jgi:CheY-like chemotaxis protein